MSSNCCYLPKEEVWEKKIATMIVDSDAMMYTDHDHDANIYGTLAQVKDIYYKEMADLLKKATGAEHVEMFHHQVSFPKMVFGD